MIAIKVNKIQAATRQIELAIRLLFQNEDVVGIHTLAAAGFTILHDLGKAKNSQLSQYLVNVIKPEMGKKFWDMFNRYANFFKHADRDPEGVLEDIQDEANDVLILFACFWYKDIKSQWTPTMLAFVAWYIILHPEIFDYLQDDTVMRQIVQDEEMSKLRSKPRKAQIDEGKIFIERAISLMKSI